jgi:fumarate reductase flavoprotein subunit
VKYDVITIGGGFAGMVTACRAAQLGLKAAVLERESDERYRCNSRYTTGVFAVMGQPARSSVEHLLDALIKGTDGTAHPEVARTIANNAGRAADWLMQEGARFMAVTTPGGRQLMLGPPRRFKEGLDWEGRGGDVLLRRFAETLASRGGQLLRGTSVESLIVEGGRCVGINATQAGRSIRIDGGAVVIADGGFQANADMVRKYIAPRPERVLVRAAPGGTGDGIRMAEAAGAAVGGFGGFYGHIHHRDAMTNDRLWPYPHFDAMAEVSMLVGADGRRFTDEGLGGVRMTNAIAQLEDPLSSCIIYDDAMWNGEPGKAPPVACNPFLMSGGGWMHSAPDIKSLATKAGLPADALEQTVREYNEAIGQNRVESLKPERSTRRFKPLPIAKAPFHAVPLCAGITQSMGGVVIDGNARALRPDGSALPGLYVVGASVAGAEGGPRVGYTGGLCKAFTLGLAAAEHMASDLK